MPERTINIYSEIKEKTKDASLESYKLEQELEKKNELQRQLKDKEKEQFDTAVNQSKKEKELKNKEKALNQKEEKLNNKKQSLDEREKKDY